MTRTLVFAAFLAIVTGCSSTHKAVTNGPGGKPTEPPKQYEYRDMSRGSTAFQR
ncbi:hypothetical protein P12x_001410 [Tundrisphaera lichenicola]|uniref:hypothetical protein n=1 Tax=Tundrisphaera lichenicola TaxID=2029860 RepID=UPI003EBB787D